MGVRPWGVVAAFLCATSGAVFACSSFSGDAPNGDDAGTSPTTSSTAPPTPTTDSGVPPPRDADADDGDGGPTDAGYYFEDFEGDGPAAFWVAPTPPRIMGNVDVTPDKHHSGTHSLHASSLVGNGQHSAYWAIDVPEPFVSVDIALHVWLQDPPFATEIVDIHDSNDDRYAAGLSGPNNTWSISESKVTGGGAGAAGFGMPKRNDWVPCSIHIDGVARARMTCGTDKGELTGTLTPFSSKSGTTRLSFGIISASAQGDLFLDDITVQVLR